MLEEGPAGRGKDAYLLLRRGKDTSIIRGRRDSSIRRERRDSHIRGGGTIRVGTIRRGKSRPSIIKRVRDGDGNRNGSKSEKRDEFELHFFL